MQEFAEFARKVHISCRTTRERPYSLWHRSSLLDYHQLPNRPEQRRKIGVNMQFPALCFTGKL
jgi:hypothetical protein